MRNIWRIFKTDMKHLFNNSITVIIVIGLVFLPSIFTWYNVIACWDAFGNTGNLTVAVANTDEDKNSRVPLFHGRAPPAHQYQSLQVFCLIPPDHNDHASLLLPCSV